MTKRLFLKPKPELTLQQQQSVIARLSAPAHEKDNGPIRVWNTYSHGLYAFFRILDREFIGIAESSGTPLTTAGWWIDSRFRGEGYGNDLVDLLADTRRSEGVSGVTNSPIDSHLGQYAAASGRLMERFRQRLQSKSQ